MLSITTKGCHCVYGAPVYSMFQSKASSHVTYRRYVDCNGQYQQNAQQKILLSTFQKIYNMNNVYTHSNYSSV